MRFRLKLLVALSVVLLPAFVFAQERQAPPEPELQLLAAAQPAPDQAAPPSGMPAEPSAAEPAPAQPPAAEPSAVPAAPIGPDPVFDDWGAPGSDVVPPGPPKIEAALMLGVGASFDDTVGSVNPLGFGFGLRGSYRLLPQLPQLAVGGRFLYYAGGSAEVPNGEVAMSSWLLAAEAAYVFPIGGMLLEPGLALGLTSRSVEGRVSSVTMDMGVLPLNLDDTQLGFYLAPGAALVVPMSLLIEGADQFFIGADVRLSMVFGDAVSGALELMAQGGVRF